MSIGLYCDFYRLCVVAILVSVCESDFVCPVLCTAICVHNVNETCFAGYIAPWSGRFYSLYDTG